MDKEYKKINPETYMINGMFDSSSLVGVPIKLGRDKEIMELFDDITKQLINESLVQISDVDDKTFVSYMDDKFTAKKSDGTAEVKFTIDTTKYDELVVFEELYYGKTLIGEHKDINDKAQTVSFSDTDTPPSRVPTGVSAMLIVLLAIMLIGGGAGIFFFKKKIR